MSTTAKVLLAIAGVIAVVAAAATGWVAWSSSQADELEPVMLTVQPSSSSAASDSVDPSKSTTTVIVTETEVAIPDTKARCDTSVITQTKGFERMTKVLYCDGTYLRTGVPNTGSIAIALWDGDQWDKIDSDGTVNGFPCYDPKRLNSLGFPQDIISEVIACEDASAQLQNKQSRYIESVGLGEGEVAKVSSPACDGRYILIYESVLDDGSGEAVSDIAIAISGHPEREYTYPGQCSSLRGQLDGQDIYPIYQDFGTDLQAMCAAKHQYGGNGRTLNTYGDFTDPCA